MSKNTSLEKLDKDHEKITIDGLPYYVDYKAKFFIFMVMGFGANFVFATALTQEIPYFINTQPEGLCLPSYMAATLNGGLLVLFAYLYIYNNIYKIPYSTSVPFILVLSTFGCVFTAFTYSITVGNLSLFIYISCFIGGTVGALSSVIISPFLMSYENNMITAARSGSSSLILVTSLIALIQGPGSANRFSVSVYMIILAVIEILPVFAFLYICRTNIGLRKDEALYSAIKSNDNDSSFYDSDSLKDGLVVTKDLDFIKADTIHKKDFIDYFIDSIIGNIVPLKLQVSYPWLCQVLPYALAVAWFDFNFYGVEQAALPFAISNVSVTDSAADSNLALAYEIGAFCLVFGDLSTAKFRIPIKIGVTLLSICCFVIYLAAFDLLGVKSEVKSSILIVLYCCTQYLESHMLTTTFRACATEFNEEYRESASKTVGLFDQG